MVVLDAVQRQAGSRKQIGIENRNRFAKIPVRTFFAMSAPLAETGQHAVLQSLDFREHGIAEAFRHLAFAEAAG